jgi:capsular exopolysaccharide synthesis family protein
VQQDSEAFNLERALGVLRRRAPLIALCIVVVAGAAFGFSRQQTKKYTASASINFNTNQLSQQIAGLSANSASNSSMLLSQEAADVELVKGGDAAAKTASLLDHGLTERRVVESLSVAGQGESPIVVVSATTTSPALSAQIVNSYADQFVKGQQSANLRYFKAARAIVRKQLAALSPQQRVGADGLNLQNRVQTLSLLSELKVGNVAVASEALPPTSPSSPKTSKNTALGAFLGLLIGLGLVFALERLDRRIGGPEELEAIYRLPLLGAIPQSAALARSARTKGGKRAVLPPAEAEGFSLIRARLRFFNIDRDLRTVVVASAEPGDGKTMIARHLAEAAARLGSRVLLLEVDLRHPTLAQQLGISPGPGLADVLIGAIPMGEATQSVDLDAPPGDGAEGRALDVLAAGAVLPPNPGELLESQAMDAVLERTRSAYDLVVIDTPPLTAVSDAFPLLTKVDGIVIVGRVGRSQRHAAEQLHQVLASSGVPLLGVIANGSKSAGPSVYAYSRDGKSSPAVASVNGASSSEELAPTVKAL